MAFIAPLILVVFAVLLAASSIRILREYERGVVFQLGRFWRVKGPGMVLLVPLIQQMVRVQLRTVVLDVPSQDVISRDNVSVKVNAVVYFRIVDPQKAIIEVDDTFRALHDLARHVRQRVPEKLAGITGSAGKTTTKELLGAILATRFRVSWTPGNLNNLYGFPLSLLNVPDGTEWMVAEMGRGMRGRLAAVIGHRRLGFWHQPA